jgi:hypothetical protein
MVRIDDYGTFTTFCIGHPFDGRGMGEPVTRAGCHIDQILTEMSEQGWLTIHQLLAQCRVQMNGIVIGCDGGELSAFVGCETVFHGAGHLNSQVMDADAIAEELRKGTFYQTFELIFQSRDMLFIHIGHYNGG